MSQRHDALTRSLSECCDSRQLNLIDADKFTRFYQVPSSRFSNETQVLQYYGYKLGQRFAEGGFSQIFYATHTVTNIQVACKKIDLLKTKSKAKDTDKSKIEDLKNELFILKKINNPYIVKLYAHFVVNTNLFIFLKLANSGTLARYVHMKGVLKERESQMLFSQMLVAIEYIHSLNIAHRDMKLENILLIRHPNNKITILITDFGLSRMVSYDTNGSVVMNRTYCGTIDYMAPEIISERPYNALTADIWSLGICLYVMLNDTFPFEAKNPYYQLQLQLKHCWAFSDNVAENPQDSLIHILTLMLEPDPLKRITISALVHHPWIVDEYLFAKNYFQNFNQLKSIQRQQLQQRQQSKPQQRFSKRFSKRFFKRPFFKKKQEASPEKTSRK
ncbi:hypothetical protein DERP_005781 [Dermatophagoides pteronyssinus]|uniref:Protein kinase domain-containing protein n=1 Tax=Dermatophagoides pteronyssinus TaxID=6956 RepID=A0ABQ8J9L9_DERPT|nr:hypothetical protein DERP_005781 [Dermatophagoides pteronyssinus]